MIYDKTHSEHYNHCHEYVNSRTKVLVQLDLLKEMKGKAIIAGGFIRDTLFNLVPSDVDIFYNDEDALSEDFLEEYGIPEITHGYGDTQDWKLTHETMWDGKKVQFIHTSLTWNELFESFPCNISRVGLTKEGEFITHHTAEKTLSNSYPIYWNKGTASGDYFNKIYAKYQIRKHRVLNHAETEAFLGLHGIDPHAFGTLLEGPPPGNLDLFSFTQEMHNQLKKKEPKKYLILNAGPDVFREFA